MANLHDDQRTAILIDPINRTVETVPYSGDLGEFQALTGGDTIAAAPVINAFPGGRLDEDDYWIEGDCSIKGYRFEDTILNNELAMMQDDCAFFRFPLHPDPVAGPTLIVGVDSEGKSTAPGLTADDLRPLVEFMGMDISGYARRDNAVDSRNW